MLADSLPYQQIPEYPANYSSGHVLSRLIDGLGYRYFWATEGLRPEDLAYRPTPEARSASETLDHLYGLSLTIRNAAAQKPNIRPLKDIPEDFLIKRKLTLQFFAETSQLLQRVNSQDLEDLPLVFKFGEKESSFPFWHMINGPIADALNHVGQIVSFRRSSGNPINPKVNVFMGKTGQ